MIVKEIDNKMKMVKPEEGKYLHNKGSDLYYTIMYANINSDISNIEEVDEIPEQEEVIEDESDR